MPHLLVISDAAGKEIARVPIEAGYTIKEIVAALQAAPAPVDKDVFTGDVGIGKGNVS